VNGRVLDQSQQRGPSGPPFRPCSHPKCLSLRWLEDQRSGQSRGIRSRDLRRRGKQAAHPPAPAVGPEHRLEVPPVGRRQVQRPHHRQTPSGLRQTRRSRTCKRIHVTSQGPGWDGRPHWSKPRRQPRPHASRPPPNRNHRRSDQLRHPAAHWGGSRPTVLGRTAMVAAAATSQRTQPPRSSPKLIQRASGLMCRCDDVQVRRLDERTRLTREWHRMTAATRQRGRKNRRDAASESKAPYQGLRGLANVPRPNPGDMGLFGWLCLLAVDLTREKREGGEDEETVVEGVGATYGGGSRGGLLPLANGHPPTPNPAYPGLFLTDFTYASWAMLADPSQREYTRRRLISVVTMVVRALTAEGLRRSPLMHALALEHIGTDRVVPCSTCSKPFYHVSSR